MISILDHMLSSLPLEKLRDLTPLLTFLLHLAHQEKIFLRRPMALFDPWIQVIGPSFPNTWPISHEFLPRKAEKLKSNSFPLQFGVNVVFRSDDFLQKATFLCPPCVL